jgi:hypothetical protein
MRTVRMHRAWITAARPRPVTNYLAVVACTAAAFIGAVVVGIDPGGRARNMEIQVFLNELGFATEKADGRWDSSWSHSLTNFATFYGYRDINAPEAASLMALREAATGYRAESWE